MKLAIFGGTGTVGSALVSQGLDAGHEIRLLARTPSKVTKSHRRLSVVAGDARDDTAVSRTIAGSDAVLSALGGVG
ncbi:MAG TPA: NAD(P)H-binding protein, partial [Mycobacterium sp.]